MNGRPLTDAQISRALRAHLPERAAPGLRERVLDAAATTTQQRPMPSFLARLVDADPVARRRSLLLAAALLAALTLGVVAGVGAWLDSQRHGPDMLSLEPPADVDAYVAGAYAGLRELPALTVTIVDVDGTKARYAYDGVGTLRYDHYSSPTDAQPSQSRIISEDRAGERVVLADGQQRWVVYDGQPNPLQELAHATGLEPSCDTPWAYVALEYLIARPAHHVACGGSAMWIDVETGLPLKSVRDQPDDLPTVTFEALALEVGPQPWDLFVPPAGLATMSGAEYQCVVDPECGSPAPATPRRSEAPPSAPPPAPGDYATPEDLDAFVADIHRQYATLPALEMWIHRYRGGTEERMRYVYDGAGLARDERDFVGDEPGLVIVRTDDGHIYESRGLTEDGRPIWKDGGFFDLPVLRPLALECGPGWEHRGFDLVNDRPAHHLVCGQTDYWVDREWRLAVRSESKDPLADHPDIFEVIELTFAEQPAELFELPDDAVVCDMVRDGRCVDASGDPQDLPSASPVPSPSS